MQLQACNAMSPLNRWFWLLWGLFEVVQAEINTMNEYRGLAFGHRSEMVGVEGLHHGQTDVNRGLHVPQSFYHEQDLVNAHTHTEMMTPTPPRPQIVNTVSSIKILRESVTKSPKKCRTCTRYSAPSIQP